MNSARPFDGLGLAPGRERLVIAVAMTLAVPLGLTAGALAVSGRLILLAGVLLFVLPTLVWKRAEIGVFGLAFTAVIVEQYHIGASVSDLTDRIPLFVSLNDGFHISGIYVNPAEIVLIMIGLIAVLRGALQHQFLRPSAPMGVAVLALIGALVLGEARGLAAGGDWKMTLWELRPFVYLTSLYLIALQLGTRRQLVPTFLWGFVVAEGVKATQGMAVLVASRGAAGVRPDYLMTHEEAFFLGLFMLLVLGLWLFGIKGRMRTVSTALFPFVAIVTLANSRRTAWLILASGVILMMVCAWIRQRERRRTLLIAMGVTALAVAIYLPSYWNSSGTVGQPARAIRSAVSPSERDRLSDLYRRVENANLQLAIRRSMPLGVGFGVPINYEIPIVDLSRTDPFIKYITHNGMLYVWMRMGLLGVLAFWYCIGGSILVAARLVRAADPLAAMFGAFALCAVGGYVIEGYYDLGLFWFRMAIFMGVCVAITDLALQRSLVGGGPIADPNSYSSTVGRRNGSVPEPT